MEGLAGPTLDRPGEKALWVGTRSAGLRQPDVGGQGLDGRGFGGVGEALSAGGAECAVPVDQVGTPFVGETDLIEAVASGPVAARRRGPWASPDGAPSDACSAACTGTPENVVPPADTARFGRCPFVLCSRIGTVRLTRPEASERYRMRSVADRLPKGIIPDGGGLAGGRSCGWWGGRVEALTKC
ncbi:hypothetical protein GCM10010430_07120 [Kitasatospora cystarginea]|uniref:Uncharacterized protein n=1 Tax=Kitasatospora cystarginea TaxID=58350 RepID=A0ABP5Q9X6_9ACTN